MKNVLRTKIARETELEFYPSTMQVAFEGGGKGLAEYFCVLDEVEIKLNESTIKVIKNVKFFLMDNLLSEMIIGQETIFREKLYGVMEMVDAVELGEDSEVDDLEYAMEEVENGQQGYISAIDTIEEDTELVKELEDLVVEFSDVFATELTKESAAVSPFVFELKDKIAEFPRSLRGGERRQPQAWYEKARPLVQELLQAQVIQRSNSSIYSHVHLAPKPGSAEMRLTIDYKVMNSITKATGNVMPLIDSFLEWVAHRRPKYFCKMDLLKGYFQFPIAEECRFLTSFRFEDLIYEFLRLPMGLSQAACYCQTIMSNEVLQELTNEIAKVYLDDLLVIGQRNDIVPNLRKVFERLRDKRIRLKRSKCQFGVREVDFLGFHISGEEMRMTDDKMMTFDRYQKPRDTTSLRRFLGSINFFRRFFNNLAAEAIPLYKLAQGKKKMRIIWNDEADRAFEKLRKQAAERIILRWPTAEGELVLFTDASGGAIGGWLGQKQGEKDEEGNAVYSPIKFFSKSFSAAEKKWSVSDREAYAIVFGVLHLHNFLAGRPFTVFTDHRALIYNDQSVSAKIERIKLKLSTYDITYKYIKGEDNIIADALSRDFIDGDQEIEEPGETGEIWEGIESVATVQTMEEEDVRSLLHYYHGDIQDGACGHYGAEKTIAKIEREGNQWPNFEREVKEFIRDCTVCQQNRRRLRTNHGRTFDLQGEDTGDIWSVDIMELGEDTKQYKYILVIIDNFSKWTTLRPLRSLEKEESAIILWRLFLEDGFPNTIIYDQGRTIDNMFFRELIAFLQINGINTSAGGHEENGVVERMIGEVREQLMKCYQEAVRQKRPVDWSWMLPVIARNHNTNKHATTGQIPAVIRFGSSNRLGGEEDQRLAIEGAKFALEKRVQSRTETKNRNEIIEQGDLVWLMNPKREKRDLTNARWLEGRVLGRARDMVEVEYEGGKTLVNVSCVRLR